MTKINERITLVSQALVASEVWDILAREDVSLVASEQFDTFFIEQTPVYAVPDLLYKSEDGQWTIVDWKTGEEVEDNEDQVALYALYVHEKHGVAPEQIRARLEYLSLGITKETSFTQEGLAEVEKRAKASMAQMRKLLLDPVQNIPRPKIDFALTDARAMCPWCNFYELCQQELGRIVS